MNGEQKLTPNSSLNRKYQPLGSVVKNKHFNSVSSLLCSIMLYRGKNVKTFTMVSNNTIRFTHKQCNQLALFEDRDESQSSQAGVSSLV